PGSMTRSRPARASTRPKRFTTCRASTVAVIAVLLPIPGTSARSLIVIDHCSIPGSVLQSDHGVKAWRAGTGRHPRWRRGRPGRGTADRTAVVDTSPARPPAPAAVARRGRRGRDPGPRPGGRRRAHGPAARGRTRDRLGDPLLAREREGRARRARLRPCHGRGGAPRAGPVTMAGTAQGPRASGLPGAPTTPRPRP